VTENNHVLKMPSRSVMSVECSCGEIVYGRATWDEWEWIVGKHMAATSKYLLMLRDRLRAKPPVVLEELPTGGFLTLEWCDKHGLTKFTVRIKEEGRSRRCRAHMRDRERNKRLHSVTS